MSDETMRADFEEWKKRNGVVGGAGLLTRIWNAAYEAALDRRATSGAASGEVPDAVIANLWELNGAGGIFPFVRAIEAYQAEQSAPPVPRMESLTVYEFSAFDNGERQQYVLLSDARALLATQSASTAPGQADTEQWEGAMREAVAHMAKGYEYGAAYYNQDIFVNGLKTVFRLCGIEIKEDWES